MQKKINKYQFKKSIKVDIKNKLTTLGKVYQSNDQILFLFVCVRVTDGYRVVVMFHCICNGYYYLYVLLYTVLLMSKFDPNSYSFVFCLFLFFRFFLFAIDFFSLMYELKCHQQ